MPRLMQQDEPLHERESQQHLADCPGPQTSRKREPGAERGQAAGKPEKEPACGIARLQMSYGFEFGGRHGCRVDPVSPRSGKYRLVHSVVFVTLRSDDTVLLRRPLYFFPEGCEPNFEILNHVLRGPPESLFAVGA